MAKKNLAFERKRKASKGALVAILIVGVLVAVQQWAGYLSEFSDSGRLSRLTKHAKSISYRKGYWSHTIRAAGATHQADLARLEYIARVVLNYDLEYVEDLAKETGDFGQTWRGRHPLTGEVMRSIRIDDGLKVNAKVYILAHELGHTLQPESFGRDESEAFAEAVAVVVMGRFGIREFDDASANYLSQGKSSLDVIDLYRSDLLWAAGVIASD